MTTGAPTGPDTWSSVTEQSIFLDDGLQYIVEALQSPSVSNEHTALDSVFDHKFDSSSNAEICKCLLSSCAVQHGSYYKFFSYRQRALLGLWHSMKAKFKKLKKHFRPPAAPKSFTTGDKTKGQQQNVSFSSHVSLLLLLPILQSQSLRDTSLAGQCSEVLLQCLQSCPPNSLAVEPLSCIKGLADLLCSWLLQAEQNSGESNVAVCAIKRENVLASLVSLACGRFSIQLFVQVLSVLLKHGTTLSKLPVGTILRSTLEYERKGSFSDLSFLQTSRFVNSWQFETFLTESNEDISGDQISSLTCDGKFLYLVSGDNKGLHKIGTGKNGTIRGAVYNRNIDLKDGWLAFAQSRLLFRPKEFDSDPANMCYLLDKHSLQIIQIIRLINPTEPESDSTQLTSQRNTVQILSDEVNLYWLWIEKIPDSAGKEFLENKKVDLLLQELKLELSHGKLIASPCRDAVVVTKREEPSSLSSPLAVRRSPTTPTAQNNSDEVVSCGISGNTLKQTAMFISGDMLVMVIPQLSNTSAPLLLAFRGPRSPSNYCFSTLDGSFVKHENVINSAMAKQDLLVPGLVVCQDCVNGRLWSYDSNHMVGEWISGGYPSCNQVSQLVRTSTQSQASDLLDPKDVILSLANHITFLSKRLYAKIQVASIEECERPASGFSDSQDANLICSVLNTAITEGQQDVLVAMLAALQTFLSQVLAGQAKLEESDVTGLRLVLWKLVCSPSGSIGADVQLQSCNVLKTGLEVFYPTEEEKNALLMLLLSEGDSSSGMTKLLDILFIHLAEEMMNNEPGVSSIGRLSEDVNVAALNMCVKESCNVILLCSSLGDDEFHGLVTKHPDLSPVLQYVTAVFIINWKEVVLSDGMESPAALSNAVKHAECQTLSLKMLEASQQVLDKVLEVLSKLSAEYKGDRKPRIEGIEHLMKSTLVGQILPLLASVLSSEACLGLSLAKGFLPSVTTLTVTATKVAYLISEMKSSGEVKIDEVSSAAAPSPWSSPRKVESPHPVRDDYQCCKTVVLPGAQSLFLKFDPRCATQYDYDKVIVYAGKSTACRKVAEFGGNSCGVGSRGVVRLGWPKEPFKVEGEAVTLSFQVKSARERNTPDHAIWGFSCTVSSKEHDEKPSKFPFFNDLCLSLSLLTYSLLNVKYQGPANSEAEDACQHLLDSKLLQRCVWATASEELSSGTSGILITVEPDKSTVDSVENMMAKPNARLSPELLKRLKDASGVASPTLRPSMRQALQPEDIEETVVRCVVNHLGLTKTVHGLDLLQATEPQAEEYSYLCSVMNEVFIRLNGLIRQLQTMAEMELKWAHELDEVRGEILQPSAAFFNDFHLQEAKSKELELLCSLKKVNFDPIEQERSVGKLIERLEVESKQAFQESNNSLDRMPVTKKFLFSIMESAELLCNVTIESSRHRLSPQRSVSICSSIVDCGQPSQQEAPMKDQLQSSSSVSLSRSFSAPPKLDRSLSVQEGIHDVRRLQRWRTNVRKKHGDRNTDETDSYENNETFVSTIAEIFTFIGGDPDKAVTCSSFLSAARIRNERGMDRIQALQYMAELVSVCSQIGIHHVPHLLSVVASILVQGPRTEELKCGGLVVEVRDMFSAVVSAVVQQASTEPAVYRDSVLLLSICPFSWHEERCVMRSSLVSLLDKLCCMRNEKSDSAVSLSGMAWAGFQVLLDRIVQWEKDKDFYAGAIEWSSLAHQVSSLLSNYLTCVLEESRENGVTAKDPLQYVMELLHRISRSKLGEGILREPRTISTLLSLLLDRRAPPKLVLIVLKLCRSALPLVSAKGCEEVTLPASARHYLGQKHGLHHGGSSVDRVASLLLTKLGDFLLPSVDADEEEEEEEESENEVEEYGENELSSKNEGTLSVYLHKRVDQSAHEIVQKVLSTNGTPFIFRVGQGSEMERAIRLDQELTEYGRGVLLTDTRSMCLKIAAQWAQTGLVLSVGPGGLLDEDVVADKSVEASEDPEFVCKARNSRLTRTESSRPYISGQVAHTMASEVISLLHGLLASSVSDTSKIWASAVQDVLCKALDNVPELVKALEAEGRASQKGDHILTRDPEPNENGQFSAEHEWVFKARNVVAALSALGGFRQNVHSGCEVKICGEDLVDTTGDVVSVSERQGVATVLLNRQGETYSDMVKEIPLARLQVINPQMVYLSELSMGDQAVAALLSILSSKETPLDQPAEVEQGEKLLQPSQAARILAEIRTRASMVLSCQVRDSSFSNTLLAANPSLELISKLAAECDPGQRLIVLEKHCQQLRKLFKDFLKPSDHPKKTIKNNKRIVLDGSRAFPPVRGCVFTERNTCVHFMADPAAGFGLPRGTFLYASAPLPLKAPSFYWEVELCSLGDPEDQEPGPCVSVGFAPWTYHLESGWINPVGSCLLHSNGRAVLYRTGGLLQWKTVSLNIVMKENDVIGCGFKKGEDQPGKASVYFTYNGDRLAEELEGVQAGLWPVVHIQKKNVRVRVNFGARVFLYAEGSKHRAAADMWSDSMEDIRMAFLELPFGFDPDAITEEISDGQVLSKPSVPKPAHLSIPEDQGREYDPMACLQYKLSSSYDRMIDVGPVTPLRAIEEGTSQWGETQQVDPSRLLIKAWEDRVFPVIRRRFRSQTDRQSGLEQIRGALLAGMIDIAIATVADLYEDGGGIPATLQFPRPEDVKDEVNKVSAGGLKPGQAVIVNSSLSSALPGFAVPAMKKTFGLTGVVKSVDKFKGLTEVETYNREEGTLMRFWYPISALGRPSPGLARSSSLVLYSEDRTCAEIYCELLRNEACLTRMYCRETYARLLARKAESQSQITDMLCLVQTLAIQQLAPPQADGTVVMTTPHSAPDPRHCLLANTLQPSAMFFNEPAVVVSEVRKLLSLAVELDEEEVHRIVNTVCEVLKDAPLAGYHREVSVNAGKPDEEVLIPGAAVTVVSCKEDPACLSAGGVCNPRSACVSISCYHGNRKLNKNGQEARYTVVQYPDSCDANLPSKANQYPDVVLPCNRLHIRFLSSATEGLLLHLSAFPAEYFLSLVFIEVFLQVYLENAQEFFRTDGQGNVGVERKALIHKTVLFNLTDILSSYLLKSDLPAVIKEIIYHLLAQVIRAWYHVESHAVRCPSPNHWNTYDLFLSRLAPLRTELQKLLEKELSATNTAALDFILNCNFEHSKFSSYLQALLELVSAAHEVSLSRGKSLSIKAVQEALQAAVSDSTDTVVRSAPPSSVENTFNFETVVPPSSMETAPSSGPPSPKCKASERRGSVRRRKRGFGFGVTSPTESMPWFDEVVKTTLFLRNLIHGDARGSTQLSNRLAAVIPTRSTALQRLLVITNIPITLTKKEAVDAISKACRPCGGIYEDQVHMPEVVSPVTAEESDLEEGSNDVVARVKAMTKLLPSAQQRNLGYAVVQLKNASQLDLVRQAILTNKTLKDPSSPESVGVTKVNSELLMEGTNELVAFAVFDVFLNDRIFSDESESLSESAKTALLEIFTSCARSTGNDLKEMKPDVEIVMELRPRESFETCTSSGTDRKGSSEPQTEDRVFLTKDQICSAVPNNLLLSFFNAVRHARESTSELVTQLLREHGCTIEESDGRGLGTQGFLMWVLIRARQDVRVVWKGIIACGYDLQFNRCTHVVPSEMESDHADWSVARDHALVSYVDTLCRALSTTPSRLMPDELFLSEVDFTNENFHNLQGVSLRSIRSRFAFLKSLNSDVERLLLPVTDLRAGDCYNLSTAALLREARGLLFYHTKVALLNHVLNQTAHRGTEDSPPEVSLDPLESLEADKVSSAGPQFSQAASHILNVSSSGLRVKVATGGDPVFPLKVHLRGEQVLGSGGSFRHFMWLMARELQGSHVGLLVPCPSSAANKNKGKFIMKPGPITYAEENLLIFFGQVDICTENRALHRSPIPALRKCDQR
ncbi:probable E3 ubiquitin-protein ligase HECTD4 isoform X3 [Montipora foliosa]|uniref:probable E3 ubiquitin-protein ligase HECTD4 isoform X3 n=1 Tax=Montipora foliosa TaxID=591990 RepID=UPI0035F21049